MNRKLVEHSEWKKMAEVLATELALEELEEAVVEIEPTDIDELTHFLLVRRAFHLVRLLTPSN